MSALFLNRGLLLLVLIVGLAIYAWRRGGGPERATTLVFAGMMITDRIFHFIASGGESVWAFSSYTQVVVGHLMIDSAAAAVLVAIGLRANRMYPLWLAGIQGIAVLSHFSRELSPVISSIVYAIFERAPFYAQMAILIGALIAHRKRVRIYGTYRDWKSW